MGSTSYRPKQADRFAKEREQSKHGLYKLNPVLISMIIERLEQKWSPEQISNRLRIEGHETVSAETIYRLISEDRKSGGELWKHLRRTHRRRKRRFPSEERRGVIQKATPLKRRPKRANERKRAGDWKRDTMLGKDRKTSVLVVTDRKSRFNKFRKLDRKKAKTVTKETIVALEGMPVRSLTNDRGQEFSDHESCSSKLGVTVYFCDPYSSYQRGTNENRIGVLRQYLPKGMDLTDLTNRDLEKIEFEINNRPMKCLDRKTPYEVMMQESCTGKL